MNRKIRVLSLDGGGIRGVFTSTLLIEIEKLLQEEFNDNTLLLSDYFDLIAGTSTGGIITCAMLLKEGDKYKLTLSDILNIYIKNGDDIFKKPNFFQKIKTCFGLFGSKYDKTDFKKILDSIFLDAQLKDLSKPCLITSYDIVRRNFRFFKQHYASDPNENFYVKDVVVSTSSAPTYFTSSNVSSFNNVEYELIDGGLFSNNPSYCAFVEVNKIFTDNIYTPNDIKILSIGSGMCDQSYSNTSKWGILKWISPIINISLSSNLMLADYFLKKMYESYGAENNYLRLNTLLDKSNSEMDNVSEDNISTLQVIAKKIFEINKDKIKNFLQL